MKLFVLSGGTVWGPVGIERIRKLYLDNRLDSTSRVSFDRKRWLPVEYVLQAPASRQQDDITSTGQPSIVETVERSAATPGQAGDSNCPITGTESPAESGASSPAEGFRLTFGPTEWLFCLAVFPLFLHWIVFALDLELNKTIWLTSGYYCLFFALLLRISLKVKKKLWRTGIVYALFTALIGIPLLGIWHYLPLFERFRTLLEEPGGWGEFFTGHFVCAGLFEESIKLLPLIFIGMRRKGIENPFQGIWLGIMSGLGFAWAEGVDYAIRYWHSSITDQLAIFFEGVDIGAASEVIDYHLIYRSWIAFMETQVRFMTLPLLHAGFSAVAGWFAARAYLTGNWWLFVTGLLLAAGLHGLYNSLGTSLIGVILSVLIVLIPLVLAKWANRTVTLERPHG